MNNMIGPTLLWWADPTDPLAVWAACSPVDEPYTLYWGDGTSTPMAASSGPIRHAYGRPGQYVFVAFTPRTIDSTVVVRSERADTVLTFEGDTATAQLPVVAEPVLYRIDWGDGVVTTHDATDLSPSHTYASSFGTPIIAVTDVPARWTTRYTGLPISSPLQTVFRPRTGIWSGAGDIYLYGFPPGVTVTMQLDAFDSQWIAENTIEPDGTTSFAIEFWNQPDEDWWRSARFAWTDPDSGQPRQHTQHIRTCEWTSNVYGDCSGSQYAPLTIPLTFNWDTDRPYIITVTAAPVLPGEYQITWGDGHTASRTVGNERRIDATHDYGSNQTAEVTISGMVRHGRRLVQPLQFESIDNTSDGPVLWWKQDADGNDAYRPVRIDPGDNRWPPVIESVSPTPDPAYRCGTAWTYRDAGTYVCRISAPMTDPFDHTYSQSQDRPDLEQSDHAIPPKGLVMSWKFRVGTIGGTTYTAHFDLINNTTSKWSGNWTIAFSLGHGERLFSAGEYHFTSLGRDKWRIDGYSTIPAGGTITADIGVSTSTNPPVFPRNVRTYPPSLPLS